MIAAIQQRARFYDALATGLDAGLTLEQTLATQSSDPLAQRLRAEVVAGAGLAEAVRKQPEFDPFERALIVAGEESGRLPAMLRRSARHFDVAAQTVRRTAAAMLYPLLVFHGAILLPPLFLLFTVDLGAYLARVIPLLLFLWAFLATLWAMRGNPFLSRVPGIGEVLRRAAAARFIAVLAAMQSAGEPFPKGLLLASQAAAHEPTRLDGERCAEAVRTGATLHEALVRETNFSQRFIEAVRVGETAGRLEEILDREAETAREESERTVRTFASSITVFVYAAAVLVVAWTVIGFFRGYGETLSGIG